MNLLYSKSIFFQYIILKNSDKKLKSRLNDNNNLSKIIFCV